MTGITLPTRSFPPELEGPYALARLLQSRTLIRAASILGMLLASSRAIGQLANHPAGDPLLLDIGLLLVVAGSVALALLAWSADFEHRYLPWAQVIVPVRNAIAAAHLAQVAAHGQAELLMVLPLMLIGPFFFMGLRFRSAMITGVLTAVAFVVSAAVFKLSALIAIRADLFLLIGLVVYVMAMRQFESAARTNFLESHLTAELAQRDALTGTKNRRVFDEHLARVWLQAAQDRRAIAILLVDVDHFKAYNDRYGHLAGDDALRRVARSLQTFVHRPLDILARYGGEEFAAVLFDVEVRQAVEIAERMRRAIVALAIEHKASRTQQAVSVSIGVAFIQPTTDRDNRGALQLADQALYEAKLGGRNRVELMDDAEYQLLVTGVFATIAAGPGTESEPCRRRRHRDSRSQG